ncbi:HNH endonuclease signature motif containing protein [Sinomonas notoginsengisoli]|uniref:HNH endonuclease signature motif containing protein n=1 Tax=Sinomonas notoginsengisoli TaxID=1457311 RepID=UPI001F2B3F8F|nr:HNH endonuclease signature motif containing protein [Sinomonas notoginsengisoli]
MHAPTAATLLPASASVAFASRDPGALHGALWIDPASLARPEQTARAIKALADFDAYSAAARAFLVNLLGQQIAEEPLEGRAGQPTRLGGELAHAATVSEVALLTNTSEAVAARMVNFSNALVDRHPALHDALASGDTTEAHIKVILDQASTLPEEAAEALGAEALQRLRSRKGHPRTPGELRAVVKALRERLHPESIVRRTARATADRGVWLQPEDDGLCTLTALLPVEIGFAAYKRIDATARASHGAEGEHRTMPQLRADALAQALLVDAGAGPRSASDVSGLTRLDDATRPAPVHIPEDLADLVRAEIVVHIPASVALGASDNVAELEGHGVIDAHTARALAAAAPTWQRIWTDADGTPVRLGRSAYRPPEALKRFIRYRDGTCVVPGCTRAARRSEVDHTIEWQDGGTTDADNLALLCPKHHALKSLAVFTIRREAHDEEGRVGDEGPISSKLIWKTLLGFEYSAEPLDRSHILGPRAVELDPGAATTTSVATDRLSVDRPPGPGPTQPRPQQPQLQPPPLQPPPF